MWNTEYNEEIFFPKIEDPFPFIRTHCLNPVPLINNDTCKNKNNFKFAFRCAGRKKEIKLFIDKLNYVYENCLKKFFMIRGNFGSGKSFFIRKCLFNFFFKNNKSDDVAFSYLQNTNYEKPNFVLCSYQYGSFNHIPFNAFAFIFRQIYIWLNKNIFAEENKNFKFIKLNKNNESSFGNSYNTLYRFDSIKGDSFAKLISQCQCLEYIETIEEILNCTKQDIQIKKHFNLDNYKNDILPIQNSSMFSNIKRSPLSKIKKKVPFFDKSYIDNVVPLINLFHELLKYYRDQINSINKNLKKKLPLILVIENTEKIDSYSIQLLQHLLYDSCNDLKPFIVILSYQQQFLFLKNESDLIGQTKDFLLEMSLDEFELNKDEKIVSNITMKNLTEPEDIIELIKNYVLEISLYERIDSLFKVDPTLINILIDKSFCGIPLFIRDILEQLINSKLIQNCVEELLITSELEDMEEERNYNDLNIPMRIEKICGKMIDSIKEREIIILKHASIIGNFFDIQTLYSIIPFNNIPLIDLYDILVSFEKKGIIEFLYDLDPKKKKVVCKFSCPFIREVLYKKMLIKQKSEVHLKIAKLMQKNQLSYLPNHKLEKIILKKHLELGQNSILFEIERTEKDTKSKNNNEKKNSKNNNNNTNIINLNALKIILVKDICDKLRDIQLKIMENDEIEPFFGKEKLSYAIKYGMLEKKSDGKITWENRFFVMTPKVISYYYHEDEFINDKVPLATFELKDMFNIKTLDSKSFGNRKNVFSLTVTKWIKKEIPQNKRIYILSCSNIEDLYSWIITLNFMKVNAYYNSYIGQFGKIDLPLYNRNKEFKKVKKYLINIEDKVKFPKYSFLTTINNISQRRDSIKRDFIYGDTDIIKSFKDIIHIGFLLIFGNIQEGISKNKNDSFYNELKINEYSSFEEIQNPIHISYIKNLTLDDITKDDKKEDRRKYSGFQSNSSLISGISMESLLDNKTFGNKGRSSSNFMNLSNIQNIEERDEEYFTDENEHKNAIKYIEGHVQNLKHKNITFNEKPITIKNNLINETDSENEEEKEEKKESENNLNDNNNFDSFSIPLIEDTPDLTQLNTFLEKHNNLTINSILNSENLINKENKFENAVLNKLKNFDIQMNNEEQYYSKMFEDNSNL